MNVERNVSTSFGQTSGTNGGAYATTAADNASFYYNPVQQQQQQQQPQPQQQLQDPQQQPQLQQPPQTAQPLAQVPSPSSLFRFGAGNLHASVASPALARAISTLSQDKNRRPRSEKKPIPDEQKDDKYYERRRRNNEAAKKSRDARKSREDELAIRASFLEKDNSVLKVQVMSMREEAMKLRQMWFQKCQSGGFGVNRQGMGPPPQPAGGRTS